MMSIKSIPSMFMSVSLIIAILFFSTISGQAASINSQMSEEARRITLSTVRQRIESSSVNETGSSSTEEAQNTSESEGGQGGFPVKGRVANTVGLGLRMRTGPWSTIVGLRSEGSELDIIGQDGDWYKVRYQGQIVYMHKKYIALPESVGSDSTASAAAPTAGAVSGAAAGTVTGSGRVVNTGGIGLNIRTGPWGQIIGSFNPGAEVSVTGRSGDWYQISYNGQTAFVHADYISVDGQVAEVQPASTPSTPTTPTAPSGETAGQPEISGGSVTLQVPTRSQRDPANGPLGTSYCGPTSLGIVLDYLGNPIPTTRLAEYCRTTVNGTGAWLLLEGAQKAGYPNSFLQSSASINFLADQLRQNRPVIVNINTAGHWNAGHYYVVTGVTDSEIIINDPWAGKEIRYSHSVFMTQWKTRGNRAIVVQP